MTLFKTLYREFSKVIESLYHPYWNHPMGVAVSGGIDSMVLAHLSIKWATATGHAIHLVTVDHGLRIDSTAEATMVHDWAKTQNIPHTTLSWIHSSEKPVKRIQERARIARYELIQKWAHDHSIQCVLTAHHRCDQIETYFMRLFKGSGLKGLGAMHRVSAQFGLTILRPLLSFPKESLIAYGAEHSIPHAFDPSNENPRFFRSQVRKIHPFLSEIGIDETHIMNSITRIQEADSCITDMIQKFKENALEIISPLPNLSVTISLNSFNALHPFLQEWVIRDLIQEIGSDPYPKSQTAIHTVMKTIESTLKISRITIGQCDIIINTTCIQMTYYPDPRHAKEKCNFSNVM